MSTDSPLIFNDQIYGVLTIGTFGPDGTGVYRTWVRDRAELEHLADQLGPADREQIQTEAELEASNALVDNFETPAFEPEATS